MPEVIAPAAFNERFTLYLNNEGKPVQRTLREMTAGEVLLAMQWLTEEINRLEPLVHPIREMMEEYEATGRAPPAMAAMTSQEMEAASDLMDECAATQQKWADLARLIKANMPQWHGTGMPLREALRRYWPGGRAA